MIRIVTDSTSDLSAARVAALGIDILPLSVHFGAEIFRDGVDITKEQFYARLSTVETLPTTSQITPEVFSALFQQYVDQGDQVLGLFISSEMSGTCQSAMIARDMVDEENIAILDSRTVTFGLGLLVEAACLLRDQGLSLRELTVQVQALSGRCLVMAAVDTLKYLKMGGRISTATALVGGVLGISPIISVDNGIVNSIGKARGRKAAFQWIEKKMGEIVPDLSLPVAFGHTNSPEALADCRAVLEHLVADAPEIHPMDIGTVVGTHVGAGAAGIAYFVKE